MDMKGTSESKTKKHIGAQCNEQYVFH